MTASSKRIWNAMLTRRGGVALAIALLAGFCLKSNGADDSKREASSRRPTTLDDLPLGVACTLRIARGQVQESLTGRIERVTEEWIVLAEENALAGSPIPNKIPYISRQFKGFPEARNRQNWIPRDSVLYLSIEEQSGGKDKSRVRFAGEARGKEAHTAE